MATPPIFTAGQVLTAAQVNAIGMWKITSATDVSLTTTPTQITSVFNNTDYVNYKLFIITKAASTSNKLLFKFLSGTTPSSTLYYGGGVGGAWNSATTVYFERSSNATSLSLGYPTSSSTRVIAMDIIAPNQAISTMYSGFYIETNDANAFTWGGCHMQGVAYNGFEIATNTGTQTVDYQLFGYRA